MDFMDLPRTPSPPPPPPSPLETTSEPMDLSATDGSAPDFGHLGKHSTESEACQGENTSGEVSKPEINNVRQNQVSNVMLRGLPIVSLFIDGQERLCLAQISNTLLKTFSYNEIHNRRVALGITCVQCTPVQLEILRRAGAMPISSRRCGMITKREAERLVKSFLEDHAPPKLPENFAFKVEHSCGWGCKGSFVPARYNSSRAKCIKCMYCNMFYSPNKFIFHFHRIPDAKYRHPDAANFNSWRRHLGLDYPPPIPEEVTFVWEDVKSMFNGGSRKKITMPSLSSRVRDGSSAGQYLGGMGPGSGGHGKGLGGGGRPGMGGGMEQAKRARLDIECGGGGGGGNGNGGGMHGVKSSAVVPSAGGMTHPLFPGNTPSMSGIQNIQNLFSQPNMSPYGGLPGLFPGGPTADSAAAHFPDAARRAPMMGDLWRPKGNMNMNLPYYNPLSLFWAKNFNLGAAAAAAAQGGAMGAGYSGGVHGDGFSAGGAITGVQGFPSDMNANKPQQGGMHGIMYPSARSRQEKQTTNNNKRSSAFKPVGGFQQAIPGRSLVSPTPHPLLGDDTHCPSSPSASETSHSPDYNDVILEDDDVGEDDIDVTDIAEEEPEVTKADALGDLDHVTSSAVKMADASRDKRQEVILETNDCGPSGAVTLATTYPTPDQLAPPPGCNTTDNKGGEQIGYIFNLSKEELQTELLKMMTSRERTEGERNDETETDVLRSVNRDILTQEISRKLLDCRENMATKV